MTAMFSDPSRYAVFDHTRRGGEYIEYGRSIWLVSPAAAAAYRTGAAEIRERETALYAAIDKYTAGDPEDWRYRGAAREACVYAYRELLASLGCV